MRFRVVAVLLLALAACSHRDLEPSNGDSLAGDPLPAADPTDPAKTDPPPGDPMTGLVLTEIRGVIHMHSAYSHDGCDNNPQPEGAPNAPCVTQLREAACANGFDFVAMTDHPAIMRDHTMLEDFYYDASRGDVLIQQGGEPVANQVTCASGRKVLFEVGFESTHTTPIGLHHQLPSPDLYGDLTDAETLANCIARVQALKDAGAVAAVVHSEEDDLSAQRIVDAGVEAMEWYNVHASLLALLKGDTLTGDPLAAIDTLKGLNSFLLGSNSGTHPDLVFLKLVTNIPQGGFEKWRTVNRSRPVTGMLGTDIHRNGSVDPMCSGSYQTACELAAAAYPNALTLLISGGQLVLTDGDRLDSYARAERWLENRWLVESLTPQGIEDAIRGGRGYGVFTVFGNPQGFSFKGVAGHRMLAMGESHAGPVTLTIKTPPLPVAMLGAQFTAAEAATALTRTSLFRTDGTSTTLVREVSGLGAVLTENVSAAGAYHVEVYITPKHLTTALGDESDLASQEYLWLITNPIRVTP